MMAPPETKVVLIPWTIDEFRHLMAVRWAVDTGHISDYFMGDPRRGEVGIEIVRSRLRRRIALRALE